MTQEEGEEVRKKAVRGAAWTVGLSLGARGLQLVGTLAITYFLASDVVGEVSNAAIFAANAHIFTTLGVPNTLVSRETDARAAYHATFLMLVTGVLALGAAVALTGPFSGILNSPSLGRYLVPLALATLLQRVSAVPERLLQYKLRFRDAGLARSAGEIAYTVVSVGAAYAGAGGWALIAGHVSRAVVGFVGLSLFLSPRHWARPYPLKRQVFRDLLAFGVPLGAALWLAFAARNLDNLVVSALFGTAIAGAYQLSYSLADIPASQVGEQLGDVLTPSFARLSGEARRAALPRAMALVTLVVFPLGAGLGVTAPTVVSTLLPPKWQSTAAMPTAGMLALLAALSLSRPLGWIIGAYLQTTERPRAVMWLSGARLVAVMAAVAGLGVLFGPLGACAGVGIGFSLHALGNAVWLVRQDGFGVGELLGGVGRTLAACLPLAAAVLGARYAVAELDIRRRGAGLAIEIVAGALGYVLGAALFARPQVREALRLAGDLRRRRAG